MLPVAARADPGDTVTRTDAATGQVPAGTDMPDTATPSPNGLSVSLGASAWSGRFGFTRRTAITAATLDARYRRGGLLFSATVPYEQVISDAAIFTGIDGTPLVAAPDAASLGIRRRRDGVGDLTLGIGATVLREDRAGVDLSVSARVKLPTASNDQLSTGRTDASFRVEASRTFGRVAPVASIGYRTFGQAPRWRLRDGVAASVGASYIVGQGTVILLSYDVAERTSRYTGPLSQIVLGASRPLGQRLRLTGFAGAGLSSGAAGVSAGLSLGFRL